MAPLGGVVDGEGGLVEVVLELEPGFFKEALVFGIVRDRRELAYGFQGTQPLEVNVEETVGAGEQAGRFGGGAATQLDHRY
jgi:hypothetical protein